MSSFQKNKIMDGVNWNERFVELAKYISSWSKDRSIGVGAVAVDSNKRILSIGYNGFPSGIDDNVDERHDRPAKYMWTEHAERNLIYSAVRSGISLVGSTLYVMKYPCSDCARGIIQSGITKVICYDGGMDSSRWGDSISVGIEMFLEAGIELYDYSDETKDLVKKTIK